MDDVCVFLAATKLQQHVDSFRSEAVDGAMLLACVQEEGALQELGVAKALERARLKSNLSKQVSELAAAFTSASIGTDTAASEVPTVRETQPEAPQEPPTEATAGKSEAAETDTSPEPKVAAGHRPPRDGRKTG